MIIVNYRGGLGNQMFQYAAGKAIAERLGTEVTAEPWWFRKREAAQRRAGVAIDRPFDLRRLSVTPFRIRNRAARWIHKRLIQLGIRDHFREAGMAYDPRVLDIKDGTAISGYFQSERYFSEIKPYLRTVFRPGSATLRQRVDDTLASVRTRGKPVVAVHVRRGDYIQPDGSSMVVPFERVVAAMTRFSDVTFLLFSDDLQWCRDKFAGGDIVLSPFSDPIEDLYAMSSADHFIIANSTFSWWAAWLSDGPTKRVLAPDDWFCAGPDRPAEHETIYAAGWERY